METMYFVLGMLSIIAAAFVAVVVWGVVKIKQQQQSLNYMQRIIDEAPRELNERFNHVYRDIDDRNNYLHRRIDETTSYIDSRIDKALGTASAKQLIKG
jgi:CHASE1-domain containing sensor protein